MMMLFLKIVAYKTYHAIYFSEDLYNFLTFCNSEKAVNKKYKIFVPNVIY